jgi:hypothetical protein
MTVCKAVVALVGGSNGAYTDNLCFFRCLAVHRGVVDVQDLETQGCDLLSKDPAYHLWKSGRCHIMQGKIIPVLDTIAGHLLCTEEYIRQQRPDTKWVVHLLTNVTFYVNKLFDHPIGARVVLPDHILKNKAVVALVGGSNGAYTDNLIHGVVVLVGRTSYQPSCDVTSFCFL